MARAWNLKQPLVMAALVLLVARQLLADADTAALINRTLDTRQDLDLTGTLPQAIDLIEKKTGVHIDVDPTVWDLLPWGQETTVAATIRNAPLRDALVAITSKLALQFRLTDRGVQFEAVVALDRLGRRAELPELDVLALLTQSPLPPGPQRPTLNQLADTVDHELSARKSVFAVENHAPDPERNRPIDLPRNATLYEALESISRQTSATWYVSGTTLRIVPKRDVVQRKLVRRLSARYDGVDVAQVLLELFQRENVPFQVEPDAFARVPAANRAVHLMLQDTPLRDALQSIAGETGLKFETTDTGVNVSNPTPAPASAPTTLSTANPAPPASKPATAKATTAKQAAENK